MDYKPAENPIFRRVVIPNPATPGIDFSGTIVKPAQNSPLKAGDKVFGCGISPFAGGCLAEYALAGTDATVAIPANLSMKDASTIGVAGLTAYQSINPHISSGAHVFLNGGSGGVGVFGIQITKILGANVAVTCSGRNEELCRSLGADEVIDYTKGNIVDELAESKFGKFDHVVDNTMSGLDMFWQAERYCKSDTKMILVAGGPQLKFIWSSLKLKLLPGWAGGMKQSVSGFFAKTDTEELGLLGKWMAEGKMRAVIDSEFAFEDATKAFEKLKTGRARGKIVVQVEREEQ